MATIKDIAKKAGVSVTTVSNVLKGNTKKVSSDTIKKVDLIIKELKYIPNMNARSLVEKQSKLIGVVCNLLNSNDGNSLKDPFTAELLGVFEKEIRKRGYYMMFYTSNNPEKINNLILNWSVDGLIMLGIKEKDYILIKSCSEKPIVLIDSYYSKTKDILNVGLDDFDGGYKITKYLIENGHKNIGFVGSLDLNKNEFEIISVDQQRLKGFLKALEDFNIKNNDDSYIYIKRDEKREVQIQKILDKINKYSALIFTSDYYAVEAINYFRSFGIKVPKDISVTGFDDVSFAKISYPKLTTVKQDIIRKGNTAVNILVDAIEGDKKSKNICLPVELVIRDSVKKINLI